MECTAQVGEKVIITERRKHIKRGKEEMHSDAIFLPESALDSADCLFCSIYLLKHFFQRNASWKSKNFLPATCPKGQWKADVYNIQTNQGSSKYYDTEKVNKLMC